MPIKRRVLGLFSVIESPILVFSPKKELLYELWPRHAGFGRSCERNQVKSAPQDLADDNKKELDFANEQSIDKEQEQSFNNKRDEVRARVRALLDSWKRNVGDPKLLYSANDIGGIQLNNLNYVFIGPITPLKVSLDKTFYIENKTARMAANYWLNTRKELSRKEYHEPVITDRQLGSDDLINHSLDYSRDQLDERLDGSFEEKTTIDDSSPSELNSSFNLDDSSNDAIQELKHTPKKSLASYDEAQLNRHLFTEHKARNSELNLAESKSTLDCVREQTKALRKDEGYVGSFAQLRAAKDYDLSAIYAAVDTPYNPLDGSTHGEVFEGEEDFIKSLDLGKIGTVHNHNQLRIEVLMQEAVREGNVDKVRWVSRLPPKGKAGILGFTPLRSWQNHAHLSNVLASRAAIDAGISPEEAYTLSDKLFLMVEALDDPMMAKHMRYVIARAFAEQVKAHLDQLNDRGMVLKDEPSLVQKARFYIQQHLFDKVSLQSIAQELDCTCEHLARSFKKYHHKTVMDYVMSERVRLAKELLSESHTKIKDVAELLNFSSTAHFCHVFKAHEQLSPSQWREQNARIAEV